ncbi:MAG: metal-dependent transcriptional regulator [Clostridia bacterium]|nr:metal-dependent transcriptional regulator [Clostridia bacterium]
MHLQESGQMYLETILVLSRRLPAVRSIDIVEHMGYSKPSVSRAMGLLKNGGFIHVDEDGYITLTEDGRQVAETIFERHTVLTRALILLGVDPDIAAEDACKMEHAISDQSIDAIKKYLDSLV